MSRCITHALAAATPEEIQAQLKQALPRAAVALHREGEGEFVIYLCRSELELVAILHYMPRLRSWQIDGWSVDDSIIPAAGPQGEALADAWGRLVATWRKRLGRELIDDLGGEVGA